MGFGLPGIARGAGQALFDIEERDAREKEEARRQTAFDQQQEEYSYQKQRRSYADAHMQAMRSFMESGDIRPLVTFNNEYGDKKTQMGGKVNPDGTFSMPTVDRATGQLIPGSDRPMSTLEVLSKFDAMRDPYAAASGLASANASGTKQLVDESYKANAEAQKHQNAMQLQRLKNQGAMDAAKTRSGASGGKGGMTVPVIDENGAVVGQIGMKHSDLAANYKLMYKFPPDELQFVDPQEYERRFQEAAQNAPSFSEHIARTMRDGIRADELNALRGKSGTNLDGGEEGDSWFRGMWNGFDDTTVRSRPSGVTEESVRLALQKRQPQSTTKTPEEIVGGLYVPNPQDKQNVELQRQREIANNEAEREAFTNRQRGLSGLPQGATSQDIGLANTNEAAAYSVLTQALDKATRGRGLFDPSTLSPEILAKARVFAEKRRNVDMIRVIDLINSRFFGGR